MQTSESSPLRIAEVAVPGCTGTIGVTFCPGKCDWIWQRDLGADLDAIRTWGAGAVVTLIEPHEMRDLQVEALPREVAARDMQWYHLPIVDVSIPGKAFEAAWKDAGVQLRARLLRGERIVVHCYGGLGRAGTIAARLLVEFGEDPQAAVKAVRAARPGAIQTLEQEEYVYRCKNVVRPE
jgi:ADP-ribosyl-[dinitrogen reductase] hydrolase